MQMLPKSGDKVLWARFLPVGDVLQSGAEAMLFKQCFPDTELTFLTKQPYAQLVEDQPWCDKVITGDKKPMSEFNATLAKMKQGGYDWFISDNHGGRSALLAYISKIPHTVGTAPLQFLYGETLEKFFARAGIKNKDRTERAFFPTQENKALAQDALSALPEKKLFAIIGASKEERMWPVENWADFLRLVIDEGWGVFLCGNGETEQKFANSLEQTLCSKNLFNGVGKFTLKQLFGVADCCTAAVGNDTGTLHLASLSGLPTVGISDCNQYEWLGLTMPWFIGLSADETPTQGVHSSGGHSRELLATITAERVREALDRVLADGR